MIMCSWSCNVILYGTVFDLGGMSYLYPVMILNSHALQVRCLWCGERKSGNITLSCHRILTHYQSCRCSRTDHSDDLARRVLLHLAHRWRPTVLYPSSCNGKVATISLLCRRLGCAVWRDLHELKLCSQQRRHHRKLRRRDAPRLHLAILVDMDYLLPLPPRAVTPELLPSLSARFQCPRCNLDNWFWSRLGGELPCFGAEARCRLCFQLVLEQLWLYKQWMGFYHESLYADIWALWY
jgi:hypothetical protein